jgi:GAF domain-containing protein
LTVPLVQGDRVLGVLGFKGREGQPGWNQAQVAMVEALAEQLVLAADNQRLIDETQRRATREQSARQAAETIRAAVGVEDALQRALREMGRLLGASELVVRLGTEQDLLSGQGGDGDE